MGIALVVYEVASRCPQLLPWVMGRVDRQLRLIIGRLAARSFDGRPLIDAGEPMKELWTLARQADASFALAAELCADVPALYRDGDYFVALVRNGYLAPLANPPPARPGTPPPPLRRKSTLRRHRPPPPRM